METSTQSNSSDDRKIDAGELHEAIRRRAEEIYVQGGRVPGRDVENWMQAEREILDRIRASQHRKAVMVQVNGVQYTGEYSGNAAEGYVPGEFAAGDEVSIRFEGEKMFLKRRSGKELETRIVARN